MNWIFLKKSLESFETSIQSDVVFFSAFHEYRERLLRLRVVIIS